MHIVFFEFVDNYGGARRSTVETAQRLARHARVSVIDPYGCCEEYTAAVRAAGLEYHVLRPQPARGVGGARHNIFRRMACLATAMPDLVIVRHRLKKLLRQIGADVVCCNETKGMAIAGSVGPAPTVGFFRGWYVPELMLPYVRWVCRHSLHTLIAVSNATRRALICSRVAAEKVVAVQNPIDVPWMIEQAARPLISPLPQSDRRLRILLPAAYLVTKGQHTAVRAMHILTDRGCDAVLYLAGAVGWGEDASYVDRTRRLADELGVSDRVEWLGPRRDVPAVMNVCNAVILPTYTEGMPRAVLEAMALAKPVAATPVGGILDLILPSVTGLSFDVEDHEGLARCLMQIADDPGESERMGRRAQEFMLRNFTPQQHTTKLLEVLARAARRADVKAPPPADT